MLRVGRIVYANGRKTIPSFPGFTPIMVMTKSSEYGDLGPYVLCDEKKRNMENLWQFSKVYDEVPETTCRRSRWDQTVIWQHPHEVHVDPTTKQLTKEFWAWREKGWNVPEPIRYPVGFKHRHKCQYAIPLNSTPQSHVTQLNYIEARKAIYLPLFCRLVKTQPQFQELRKRLAAGENLLIIEVDGPHQESLPYYKFTYNVGDDFIQNSTILTTQENMRIMLNDSKHPFGHGYCLAMALLDVDNDPRWLSTPSQNPLPSFC